MSFGCRALWPTFVLPSPFETFLFPVLKAPIKFDSDGSVSLEFLMI